MRHSSILVLAAVGLIGGCATVGSLFRSDGRERFESGVEALSRGDYRSAHEDLSWVAQRFARDDEGQRAVLLLSALELDPRNPARRPEAGADMAAAFLQLPDRSEWVEPVAQTLYLVGLELGAAEERAQLAERAAEAPQRQLPSLPGPTVTARIRSLEQERERLSRRITTLEEQLAEKDRELERIRKTVK